MSRRAPRPIALALQTLAQRLEPATPLARVQAAWEGVVGAAIATHCTPDGERAGVLEVACDEAVWAAEMELMGPDIVGRIAHAPGCGAITALRARTRSPSGSDLDH